MEDYSSITTARSLIPETGALRIESVTGKEAGRLLIENIRAEESYGVAVLLSSHVDVIGANCVTDGQYSYQLVN